jgi:GT2 family glycosyltransferase
MTRDISVVVPFHGSPEPLIRCLEALNRQSVRDSMQVVVSVDGPDCPAGARAAADLVVTSPVGTGPAGARNRGWRNSAGRIILFTDSDCVPETDWAEHLAAPLREGFQGSRGVYTRGGSRAVQRLAQIEFRERYRIMEKAGRITLADTYSAGFTRQALEALGGFDETFPVPDHEDVDLSWRLVGAGGTIRFVPKAGVAHTHRDRWSAYFRLKMSRGKWRHRVLRKFPEKALTDGYTPQTLKLQMLMSPMVLPAALISLWWPPSLILWFLVFLGLTAPLARVAAGCDPGMLPLVPVFCWWRGTALAAGFVSGFSKGDRTCSLR